MAKSSLSGAFWNKLTPDNAKKSRKKVQFAANTHEMTVQWSKVVDKGC